MKRQLFLAVDIGTQSTRTALLDPQGEIVASHSTGYGLVTPRPGWAEQDPNTWWEAAVRGMRAVLQAPEAQKGEILAVCSAAQMHATIPLDASGELLSHGVQLWCDKRPGDLVSELEDHPFLEEACRVAGSPAVAAWVGFKIMWLKRYQRELYERTWKFVTGAGFINYRLCGELAIDWSEASGFFLLDAQTMQWSQPLADFLGVDIHKLPPVYPSTHIIGKVTHEAARLTGLPTGVPVLTGAGDMFSMLAATGLVARGRATDVCGTSAILAVYTEQPMLGVPVMNLHHAWPGWCPFGIIDSGGGSLRWLRDALAQAEVTEAAEKGISAYELLSEKAAAEPPGSEGLLFFPYLMGERVLGTPNARGVFFGLSLRSNIGSLARAVMEGIAFEMRRTLEIVENAGHPVERIVTTGGGASSPLWCQVKADIYQKPVYTLRVEEGGVLGSALIAMVGSGYYADAQAATRQCVQTARVFYPNPATAERYNALFEIYKDVHDRLQEPFDQLNKIL
jgi:sugar (pentulose or hexulose) kinase